MSLWECQPKDAWSLLYSNKAVLFDLRPLEVRLASGMVPGSEAVTWAEVEAKLEQDPESLMLLLCEVGQETLAWVKRMQSHQLRSVAGGFDAWFLSNLPIEPCEASDHALRYDRQMMLPDWGTEGQAKLNKASVLVVGAGGLGVAAFQYMLAAGVGRIKLIDDDVVSLSNLPRQVIYRPEDVGQYKVSMAQKWGQEQNPDVTIEVIKQRLSLTNVSAHFEAVDLVLDCSDNWPTRQLINANCQKLNLPWVFAAVTDFEYQLSAIDPRVENAPCWSCLFNDEDVQTRNCDVQGVMGMVPGVAGVRQATEAVKLILCLGTPLVGSLLTDNLLTNQSKVLKYARNPYCPHH